MTLSCIDRFLTALQQFLSYVLLTCISSWFGIHGSVVKRSSQVRSTVISHNGNVISHIVSHFLR